MFKALQIPIHKFVELSHKKPLLVTQDLTFGELLELFKREKQNVAIFLRENKPIGILTERDLLKALSQSYPFEKPAFFFS